MKLKFLFCLFVLVMACFYSKAQDSVFLNPGIQYQTIEGWGHGGGVLGGTYGPFSMLAPSVADPVNYEYLDYLVDELGLTGSRFTEVGPRIDGTGMDNGDCDSIDWTKFQSNSLPLTEANYLVYYQNKILAKGYQPNFYSSTGYPSSATLQKPWVLNHPGERAQQIWASAVYMRDTYGINMNYDVIYNEPAGAVTSTILSDDIKALAPRLASHGLNMRSQYAEAVAPQTDWNFITPVQNDSVLWSYVGRLSYHNYGTADPYRGYIYNFGLSKNIPTAQTEMAAPTFDDLYNDLTLAGTSYWEVGYAATTTLAADSGLTSFTPSATYIRLHQVIHYVPPGSVRISAVPNDALLHVLSFTKAGAVTTIIDNTNAADKQVTITGLPPGNYGLSRAQPSATTFEEMGIQTVNASGAITLMAKGGSWVTTLYPYAGSNHPPSITVFNSNPGYLVLPASSATLFASANDAELNTLTHVWTVLSSPAGATPTITFPGSYSTTATGLSMAGTYIFNIAVGDGTTIVSRQVYIIVYPSKPAPVLGQAGFRIAAPYGLVFDNPGVVTHANVELPTAAATVQIGIADIENSDFTGRGTWTIISQPAGGTASIGATVYIYVSIRANVTGMTVPGDYVFRVNVTNPGQPDLTQQVICTVHPASAAPVIGTITASPAITTILSGTSLLSALTSDPEADLLRHWWAINSVPAGAYPVFDHQGLKLTNVSGMTIPGNYVFTLRCFDDLHMVTKNVTVVVNSCTVNNWTGTVSTAWETPGNWSCGAVPDDKTPVTISSPAPHYPVISSMASCKSLTTSPGVSVLINTGYKLFVAGL